MHLPFHDSRPSHALALLLATLAITSACKKREYASQVSCISLLFQINGAKEPWALEHLATNGAVANFREVALYIKRQQMPTTCPEGGKYKLGAAGEMPTCSLPAHRVEMWFLRSTARVKVEIFGAETQACPKRAFMRSFLRVLDSTLWFPWRGESSVKTSMKRFETRRSGTVWERTV